MATVAGGLFDTNPDVSSFQLQSISSFLDTLGLSETGLAQISPGRVGGTVTFAGGTTVDMSVVTFGGNTTIQGGGSGTSISFEGTDTVFGGGSPLSVEDSSTAEQNSEVIKAFFELTTADTDAAAFILSSTGPSTAAKIIADTNAIAELTLPDTNTAALVVSIVGNIIENHTDSFGGDGQYIILEATGANSLTEYTLGQDAGNDNVLAVIRGEGSGATFNLGNYNSVLATGKSNLVITDNAGSKITAIGNTTITGGGGDDTILGGIGTHTLTGGAGSDVFGGTFTTGALKSSVVIADFNKAEGDTLHFIMDGVTDFASFLASLQGDALTQSGLNVVGTTDNGDTITITGVQLADLTSDLFTFG